MTKSGSLVSALYLVSLNSPAIRKDVSGSQLQAYWEMLPIESDKRVVLVFYENPIEVYPHGFSESFLDALSRFDGAICAISDQPNIPLQSFSPNQPNLVVNVVGWIREIVLENP